MSSKKHKNNNNNNQQNQGRRVIRIDDLATITPLTENQQKTFVKFREGKELILHGLPGTGKSFLALYLALERVLDPQYDETKVVIFRSAVATRNIGFLPGTEEEKMAVFEAPYRQLCEELFPVKNAYESLKAQGTIEFASTSHNRSLTVNNSIMIIDEMQNLTFHELDSTFTRIGKNSKIIHCGDYRQSDLSKVDEKNGILNYLKILREMRETASIEFEVDDIVRSDLVKSYIIAKLKLGLV